jgi:hypothetical protein
LFSSAWPLSGYWSASENEIPLECSSLEACPGVNQYNADSLQYDSSGARKTNLCNSVSGYEGTLCSDCAPLLFYRFDDRCRSCGLESSDKFEVGILFFIVLLIFILLSAAVAFANSSTLAIVVSTCITIQQAVVAGRDGAKAFTTPNDAVSNIFQRLSLINFDIASFKCNQRNITYSSHIHHIYRYIYIYIDIDIY